MIKNNFKRIHWAAEFIVSHQASSLVVTNEPQKKYNINTRETGGTEEYRKYALPKQLQHNSKTKHFQNASLL